MEYILFGRMRRKYFGDDEVASSAEQKLWGIADKSSIDICNGPDTFTCVLEMKQKTASAMELDEPVHSLAQCGFSRLWW
jgi:hypothetical protein